MKITSRKTHNFVELKVDRIDDTIYKSDLNEIREQILNLLDVVDDLASLNDRTIREYLEELGY